jgi:hypothetical protein
VQKSWAEATGRKNSSGLGHCCNWDRSAAVGTRLSLILEPKKQSRRGPQGQNQSERSAGQRSIRQRTDGATGAAGGAQSGGGVMEVRRRDRDDAGSSAEAHVGLDAMVDDGLRSGPDGTR